MNLENKKILITGGMGFIGSHTTVALIEAGCTPVIVDNLSNSDVSTLDRIETITGRRPVFYKNDIREETVLTRIFKDHTIDAVIHFAGLKSIGESITEPLRYYDNNINATLILCRVMALHQVKTLIFSSSATIYGNPPSVPIREDFPLAPTNPYGRSKLMIEQILGDIVAADQDWKIALLRYFNPVGAHESGLIGEESQGIPNNLMPYISQVAAGKLDCLNIFGGDYSTSDGTGVRDYIHVMDLAEGHLAALQFLIQGRMRDPLFKGMAHTSSETVPKSIPLIANLGTGRGYSVLDVVRAFEKAVGRNIPHRIIDRRPGDVAISYADPSLAARLLLWQATRDIEAMCSDAWRYENKSAAVHIATYLSRDTGFTLH